MEMLNSLKLYQIFVTALSALMIYQGIGKFIRGTSGQTFLKLSVRIIVWGGMATIALFPKVTNFIAEFIGLKGNINAVILTGFILIFLIIFKLLSAIEKLEQNISEITRSETLKKLKKQ